MKIALTLSDASVVTATLVDGPAARDLASLLPITLTFRDFHGTEKIADLPKRLSTTGEPEGTSASAGDLTYYAPWGNLALFYRDHGYASGLVALGSLDGDPSVLAGLTDGQQAVVTALG